MASPRGAERRHRHALRDLLDEMVTLTRELTTRARDLPTAELEYLHERIEWLAEEIWHEATADQ